LSTAVTLRSEAQRVAVFLIGQRDVCHGGDWKLKVDIDSSRSPVSFSQMVPVPAPDGSAPLTRNSTMASSSGVPGERSPDAIDGLPSAGMGPRRQRRHCDR
jgi:hypothetical protein